MDEGFDAFLPDAAGNEVTGNELTESSPPPYTEYAKMARYLVHKAGKVNCFIFELDVAFHLRKLRSLTRFSVTHSNLILVLNFFLMIFLWCIIILLSFHFIKL